MAGKLTVASFLGRKQAVVYHWVMTITALLGLHLYLLLHTDQFWWLTSLSIPVLVAIALRLSRTTQAAGFNVILKQTVLSVFFTELLFLVDFRL